MTDEPKPKRRYKPRGGGSKAFQAQRSPLAPNAGMTSYTPDRAAYMLQGMAAGRSIQELCRLAQEKDPTFPSPYAITDWHVADIDGFAAKFERARLCQSILHAVRTGFASRPSTRVSCTPRTPRTG